MRISPSALAGVSSSVPGRKIRICWPRRAVPTVPMRLAPTGFIVEVHVASDNP